MFAEPGVSTVPGIIISSNPDDFEMCDMLACMHGGALQEYGSTPLVMSNVRSYYHTLVEMNAPNRKKMDGLTPMRTPGGTAVIGNDQEVGKCASHGPGCILSVKESR